MSTLSDYRIGIGHGLPLGSLTLLSPQPRSTGVQPTIRRYSGSGQIYEEGLYIELVYDVVVDEFAYIALLEQFGLPIPENTAQVTVWVPGPDRSDRRYNGTAIRPEMGRDLRHDRYFLRNVIFLVRDLVQP
jgi:hypothetical protein